MPNGDHIENLQLLLRNRTRQDIIVLSSNPLRVVAAIHQGFVTIPIIPQDVVLRSDFQLKLVEQYLIHLNFTKSNIRNIQMAFYFLNVEIRDRISK